MTRPFSTATDVARYASEASIEYLGSLDQRPVDRPDARDIARAALEVALPPGPCDPMQTVERLVDSSRGGTIGTAGGRFFGMVVGGSLPAAMGARMLNAAWDQLALSDQTSPIANVAEEVASRWVLDVLGLPGTSSVGFVTGASAANLQCLAVARHALLARSGWNVGEGGLQGAPRLRIVTSATIHPTVRKMLKILGFGDADIETVPCLDDGTVQMGAFPLVDARTIVVMQAGCVNTGASDPFAEIAERIAGSGAWFHIDGAFGLWAAASPNLRGLVVGAELADSWAVDAHKWLNTPYDCGMAICAHPDAVRDLLSFDAPYVPNRVGTPQKDMVIELSRAARGIEVWAALHSLGREGVADLVDRCCRHARRFAQGLDALGFTLLNEVVQNQVVATFPGHERRMGDLARAVQHSGECWFGTTRWRNRDAIRISVSNWRTTEADVDHSLEAIAAETRRLGIAP